MQQVQLFIKDQSSVYQRVELFNDETISLTQSIQNIKDVAKVFTDFTKTFTIPATKDTNKLFKHYYNFDITGGFDARVKTVGLIKLNGVDFKKGKIKLEGVDLKDNKPNAYRVTFFGDLVDLKDIIGEDLLSDLWFLDNAKEDGTGQATFVREYSSEKIKRNLKGLDTTVSFTNASGSTETYLNAIKTPLLSCKNRLYYDSGTSSGVDGNLWWENGTSETHQHGVYWEDLKYSIAVYVIVKAIEVKYNITFSNDFFDYTTEEYSSLMMLMHRKKGQAEADYSTGIRQYTDYVDTMGVETGITSEDYTLSGVTYPLRVDSYNDRAEVSGFFTGTPPAGWDRQYFYTVTLSPDDNQLFYSAYLYFGNSIIASAEGIQGEHTFTSIGGLGSSTNGNWSIRIESADTITFGTGRITWRFRFVETSTGTTIRTGTQKVNASEFKVERKFDWLPSQQLPKMKVLDFLTGLWKMFNLTAYVEDDGTIKVQKLDAFYSGATSYDVTEFVDVNTSQVNIALPYKQINFRFKGNKTLLASKFNQLNNREFATLEYKGENPNNWVGNEYKVEVPFEKMVYERLSNDANNRTTTIMYGFMADDNQEPYIGSPLLHYATLQSPTSTYVPSISFRDTTVAHSEITDPIFMPSNQVDFTTNTNKNTINFYAELNEWTATVNLNSLFEENYKEYIQDVFNEKRRLTKVKAFLPITILSKYTLADTFIISGNKYKINSITTNLQTGESDMELLNEV
tara:strand:+ start:688 stop:2904 length:2217 start_codon:yes stop_codon:yes gene_type:complete